ncbi:hypothetical protein Q2T40_08010 [Winogradskyella maritima]|uniref:Uncharacterized protein n=1 Tax=Winogradskyella maritima TaxID=1517766 RepID=A0ABV8AJW5_9FLAO|nr:hypothetical protein [Winogradskyella maritima]
MKKLLLVFVLMFTFSTALTSCRETNNDVADDVEDVADDVEDAVD